MKKLHAKYHHHKANEESLLFNPIDARRKESNIALSSCSDESQKIQFLLHTSNRLSPSYEREGEYDDESQTISRGWESPMWWKYVNVASRNKYKVNGTIMQFIVACMCVKRAVISSNRSFFYLFALTMHMVFYYFITSTIPQIWFLLFIRVGKWVLCEQGKILLVHFACLLPISNSMLSCVSFVPSVKQWIILPFVRWQ